MPDDRDFKNYGTGKEWGPQRPQTKPNKERGRRSEDALRTKPSRPFGWSVTMTSDESIADAVEEALDWEAETTDTDGYHSNTTNPSRVTIPTGLAGYYQLQARVALTTNGSAQGFFQARFEVNGTTYYATERKSRHWSTDDPIWLHAICFQTVYLNAGDYVKVLVYQDSAGAHDVESDGSFTFFEGWLVGT